MPSQNPQYIAIDLGSNSYHLAHFEFRNGRLHNRQILKELVRMASGINPDGTLQKEVKNRALRCLQSFRNYTDANPVEKVVAMGTSAFRSIHKETHFLARASETLGLPIRVLSGDEEAQMIYRGVSFGLESQRRFVVDVGGGSTEFVIGEGHEPRKWISLNLGSIRMTNEFFNHNRVRESEVQAATSRVLSELRDHATPLKGFDVEQALGASGSVKSVLWALQHLGLCKENISYDGLTRLRPILYQTNNLDQLSQLTNLNARRAMLLPAGFSILFGTMDFFELDRLDISYQAIREGAIAPFVDHQ